MVDVLGLMVDGKMRLHENFVFKLVALHQKSNIKHQPY
jgi:hypothetical protein